MQMKMSIKIIDKSIGSECRDGRERAAGSGPAVPRIHPGYLREMRAGGPAKFSFFARKFYKILPNRMVAGSTVSDSPNFDDLPHKMCVGDTGSAQTRVFTCDFFDNPFVGTRPLSLG